MEKPTSNMTLWRLAIALCTITLWSLKAADDLATAKLEILTLTTLGEPLAAARLQLSGDGSGPKYTGVSGPDGRAYFENVPFGQWDLDVSLAGFNNHRERIRVYQPALTFHLGLVLGHPHVSQRTEIQGVVSPMKTKSKYEMWIRMVPLYSGEFLESAIDSAGRFKLLGMDVGSYVLLVIAEGKVLATRPIEVQQRKQDVFIEIN